MIATAGPPAVLPGDNTEDQMCHKCKVETRLYKYASRNFCEECTKDFCRTVIQYINQESAINEDVKKGKGKESKSASDSASSGWQGPFRSKGQESKEVYEEAPFHEEDC